MSKDNKTGYYDTFDGGTMKVKQNEEYLILENMSKDKPGRTDYITVRDNDIHEHYPDGTHAHKSKYMLESEITVDELANYILSFEQEFNFKIDSEQEFILAM